MADRWDPIKTKLSKLAPDLSPEPKPAPAFVPRAADAPKPVATAKPAAPVAPAKPKMSIEAVLERVTPSEFDEVKVAYRIYPKTWRKSFVATHAKWKDADAMADAIDAYLKE